MAITLNDTWRIAKILVLISAATVSQTSRVSAAGPCPEACKCSEGSLLEVGRIFTVTCKEQGLADVPDLKSLAKVILPIYINLEKNKISFISGLEFPAGLNVASIDLRDNEDVDISKDAFDNYAQTLKVLSLEGLGLNFDKTLKMLTSLQKLEKLSIGHNNRRGYVTNAAEDVTVPLFETPMANSLKILKMTNTGIRTLSDVSLRSLVNLRELDLSNNRFVKVPQVVKSLKELRKLSFFRCNIESLDSDAFLGLSNLQHMELSMNTIQTIDSHAFKGLEKSLKRLTLERCHLQQIPTEALRSLTALEYLDLSQNSFTSVPADSFKGEYCLKELMISSEGIQFEESSFSGQENCISHLTIKQMKLTVVPRDAIAKLNKLKFLNLDNNEIRELRKDAFYGIKAKSIILGNNPLVKIEPGALNGLPGRLDLNLKRTQVTDLDFLVGYPDDAIAAVSLEYSHLVCKCSMKPSLNATADMEIYGTCKTGAQLVYFSRNRLDTILDAVCEDERKALLNLARTISGYNFITCVTSLLLTVIITTTLQ